MSPWAICDASRERIKRYWPLLGALLSAILAGLLLAFVLYGIEQGRRQEKELQVRQLAAAVAQDIGERLERSLSAAPALTAILRQGGGVIDDFPLLARELINLYGGITALQLAPGGTIRQIEPLSGHERVIGFSPLDDPVQGPEVQRVIDSRKPGLTGPYALRQGGVGVVGRMPVFLTDKDGKEYFWGLIQVLIRIPELLLASRLSDIEAAGCHYELWRVPPGSATRQVFARSADVRLLQPVEVRIPVANGEWTLSVAPDSGWSSSGRFLVDSLLVVLGVALVGVVTYLQLRQPQLLRREVAARVRELQASEEKFRELVSSVDVILLKWDGEGRIVFINRYGEDFFGYAPGELVGRRLLGSIVPESATEGCAPALFIQQVLSDPATHVCCASENVRKNGERVRLVWRNRAICDADGQVVGVFSTGLDPLLWPPQHAGTSGHMRHGDPPVS